MQIENRNDDGSLSGRRGSPLARLPEGTIHAFQSVEVGIVKTVIEIAFLEGCLQNGC
jgi:hypothetical protein